MRSLVLLMITIPLFWSCHHMGIPHCMDDYMYEDGRCVPRPANVPPKWPDNSKTYVVQWYEEREKQKKKEKPKKVETKKSNSKRKHKLVPTKWYTDKDGKRKCDAKDLKPGEMMNCGEMWVKKPFEEKEKPKKKNNELAGKIKWETTLEDLKSARANNESYMLFFYIIEDRKTEESKSLFKQLYMIGKHINHYWHPILIGIRKDKTEHIEKVFGEMEYPVVRFFDYNGNNIANLTSGADDKTFMKAYEKTFARLRQK